MLWVNNADPEATVAHLTVWTDQAIPVLDFDHYLIVAVGYVTIDQTKGCTVRRSGRHPPRIHGQRPDTLGEAADRVPRHERAPRRLRYAPSPRRRPMTTTRGAI